MNRWKYALVGLLVGAFAFPLVWNSDPLVIGQTVTVDSTQSPLVVNTAADLADLTPTDGQSVIIKTGTEKGLWYYDKDSAAVVDSVAVLTGPGSVGRFLVISNDIGSIAAATAITAAQIDNDVDLEFGVFDADSARSLTLAELKKTGVQVVNVLQYGADPTGVADSTTGFSNAITAAMANGVPLFIPPGTYSCSTWSTLDVSSPLKIIGSSLSRPAITFNANVTAAIEVNSSLEIEGIDIDFDDATYGIEFPSVSNGSSLKVSNCKLQNASRTINGLGAPTGVLELVVENSEFTNCSYAIGMQNQKTIERIRIKNNYFHDLTDRGDSTQVNGVILGGNWTSLSEFDSQSVEVVGNTFVTLTNANASETHAVINYFPNAVIDRNVIDTVEAGGSDGGEAIYNKGYAVRVTNNYIRNGCKGGEGTIAIKGGDHSKVSTNTVVFDGNDAAVNGIYVQSDYAIISNNHVIGMNTPLLAGAIVTSGGLENEIIGNHIYGFDQSNALGISLSQATGVTVKHNEIRDCSPGSSGGAFSAIKLTATTKLSGVTADDATDVLTKASHGLSENCPVVVTSSGAVPAGLTSGTRYYAIDVTSTTFKLALEPLGSAIDLTDAGSGTIYAQIVCSGVVIESNVIRRLGPSSRGVYIGRSGLIRDVTIRNNAFDAVVGSSIYMDLSGGDDEPNGITIEGNTFRNVSSAAAYALAAMELGNCKGLTIRNNVVADYTGGNGSFNNAGILLTHNVAGENDFTVITGNRFENITNTATATRGRCINISTSAGVIQDLRISRNVFKNSYYGINQTSGGNPVTWVVEDNDWDTLTDVVNGTWTASTAYRLSNNRVDGVPSNELNVSVFPAGVLGATETYDWTKYASQSGTLDQNCVLTFTAPKYPQIITLALAQNGTGGYTITWPTINWKAGELQPDATASTTSIFQFYYDGTSYHEISVNN